MSIKSVVKEIVDVYTSGSDPYDDWHIAELEKIIGSLSLDTKQKVFKRLKSYFTGSDGWTIQDVLFLMEKLAVTKFTIKLPV